MTRRDATATFAGPVERIERKTRRNGSVHDRPLMPCAAAIAAELRRLEALAAVLTISRTDPERFFVERSELKAGIGTLAKQLEEQHGRSDRGS